MELLLWRHAEAEDGTPDHARKLSKFGKKQARNVASWLKKHAPEGARLLVSPSIRTQQTARFFREKMEICEALASDASVDEILALFDWPNAQTPVIVVGHQPMLGEIAARLLPVDRLPSSFRKGELWWCSGDPGQQAVLHAVTDPDDKAYCHAIRLEDAGKHKKAFGIFRRLARHGNTHAMLGLARLYYIGKGVPWSLEKTIKWEQKAAEAGNPSAMFNLGVTYRREGDVRTAKEWYEKALSAGNGGAAALEIAKMYLISDLEAERVKNYLLRAQAIGWLSEAEEEEIQQLLDDLSKKKTTTKQKTH